MMMIMIAIMMKMIDVTGAMSWILDTIDTSVIVGNKIGKEYHNAGNVIMIIRCGSISS